MTGYNYLKRTWPAARKRGFTLLIAVILASVATALGLALSSIAYKTLRLADTAQYSSNAFYAADSALECALYADQRGNIFDYVSHQPTPAATCAGPSGAQAIGFTVSTFDSSTLSYVSQSPAGYSSGWFPTVGNHCARLTVSKNSSGVTYLYAEGIATCNTADPREVERGIQSHYGS